MEFIRHHLSSVSTMRLVLWSYSSPWPPLLENTGYVVDCCLLLLITDIGHIRVQEHMHKSDYLFHYWLSVSVACDCVWQFLPRQPRHSNCYHPGEYESHRSSLFTVYNIDIPVNFGLRVSPWLSCRNSQCYRLRRGTRINSLIYLYLCIIYKSL